MRELSRKDGRTLLISSHQLYQIQQVCDRVGIFADGNLVACGKIQELGRQLQSENHYTLDLQVNPCDERLKEMLKNQKGLERLEQDEDLFTIYSTRDLRGELTSFLGTQGYTILHMHQKGGDLDEIYRLYFEKAGASEVYDYSEGESKKSFTLPFFRKRTNASGKK